MRRAIAGALLTAALGVAIWLSPLGDPLVLSSYDWVFRFKPRVHPEEVRVIYLDEKSETALHQQANNWDRALHARLLDRLRRDGAALVVFDIWFDNRGTDATNNLLADAIRSHGKVALAAVISHDETSAVRVSPISEPFTLFAEAAAKWGIAGVDGDKITVTRRYHPGRDPVPSLPWASAQLAGAAATTNGSIRPEDCWLNYYGPGGTLPHLSYVDALEQQPNFFKDKFVFIGSKPNTPYPKPPTDEFPTPYTRLGDGYMPGVDFAATAFLNLWRNEWLTAMPWSAEMALLIVTGLLLGFSFGLVRPWVAGGLAAAFALVASFAAVLLVTRHHLWFGWMLIAVVEIPVAWTWTFWSQRWRAEHPKAQDVEATEAVTVLSPNAATVPETSRWLTPSGSHPALADPGGTRKIATVSDHTLLRCVGRGSYGEVWLARDVIGTFHAVKIVYRTSFDSEEPYEREFHGLQKYTPISRTHPGWVHMLHIGRNDPEGYFFCIMEAGDDEVSGQEIDPHSYQPRNLARELRKQGRLPIDECVRLGVALAEALEHLHRHRLIHRDIKPSNVIFVKGVPKFADIGLVTELKAADEAVSYLGTEGYIAPEGPGAAGADVYSLGKLLYEISMGRDRREFPELPTVVLGSPETPHLRRLQRIIMRACAEDPRQRYQSASELSEDLRELQRGLETAGP